MHLQAVTFTLRGEWADGTTHLLFDPIEFLEKHAALTPCLRINLVIYHRILAPHARAPAQAVARSAAPPTGEESAPASKDAGRGLAAGGSAPVRVSSQEARAAESRPCAAEKPRDWAWADLMRRALDLDTGVPRCGGRMSVIATIEAGDVMRRILGHLGLPTEPPCPLPARPPPLVDDPFS